MERKPAAGRWVRAAEAKLPVHSGVTKAIQHPLQKRVKSVWPARFNKSLYLPGTYLIRNRIYLVQTQFSRHAINNTGFARRRTP